MSETRADIIQQIFHPVLPVDVISCRLMDRVLVVVRETELGLARLLAPTAAVKTNCEILVLTEEELDDCIDRAMTLLCTIDALSEENAEDLVPQGIFTFRDLYQVGSVRIAELLNVQLDHADTIIREAAQRVLRGDDAEC